MTKLSRASSGHGVITMRPALSPVFRPRTVLCYILLVGCGETSGAPISASRDSAGVAIVEYSSFPKAVTRWTIGERPLAIVGEGEDRDSIQFTRIGRIGAARAPGILLRSDDSFVIAEQSTRKLHAFGRNGAHLWSAGGEGQGPGEFESLAGLAILPGDSVLAYDYGNRRITVFTPDGNYARSFAAGRENDQAINAVRGALATGRVVVTATRSVPFVPGAVRSDEDVLIVTSEGERLPPFASYRGREQVYVGENGVVRGSRSPEMARNGLIAVGMEILAVSSQDEFEVEVYDGESTLRRIFRLTMPAVKVDDSIKGAYISREVALAELVGESRIRASLEDADYPLTLPTFGNLLIDSGERLWMQEYAVAVDGGSTWWVADDDGSVVAQVDNPPGFKLQAIGDAVVIGIVSNEVGVPFVQVRALEKNP